MTPHLGRFLQPPHHISFVQELSKLSPGTLTSRVSMAQYKWTSGMEYLQRKQNEIVS